jgi:hypothetical protein
MQELRSNDYTSFEDSKSRESNTKNASEIKNQFISNDNSKKNITSNFQFTKEESQNYN